MRGAGVGTHHVVHVAAGVEVEGGRRVHQAGAPSSINADPVSDHRVILGIRASQGWRSSTKYSDKRTRRSKLEHPWKRERQKPKKENNNGREDNDKHSVSQRVPGRISEKWAALAGGPITSSTMRQRSRSRVARGSMRRGPDVLPKCRSGLGPPRRTGRATLRSSKVARSVLVSFEGEGVDKFESLDGVYDEVMSVGVPCCDDDGMGEHVVVEGGADEETSPEVEAIADVTSIQVTTTFISMLRRGWYRLTRKMLSGPGCDVLVPVSLFLEPCACCVHVRDVSSLFIDLPTGFHGFLGHEGPWSGRQRCREGRYGAYEDVARCRRVSIKKWLTRKTRIIGKEPEQTQTVCPKKKKPQTKQLQQEPVADSSFRRRSERPREVNEVVLIVPWSIGYFEA
ncbi:hypothetical protein OG21DRAFT_1607063 [Imleria badia]|nr:hypothetical protein OG21DRAFT_1607063 [Imleria badia]